MKRLLLLISVFCILASASYGANDFSGDANCKALWRFESGAVPFLADSKGGNTLTNSGVDEDTVNFREGLCSGLWVRANTDRMTIADAALDAGFPLKNGEANKTFSFPFRIKLTQIDITHYILIKTGGTNKKQVLIYVVNNKVTLYTSSDGISWDGNVQHGTVLAAGIWYYICVTYNADDYSVRIQIYDANAGEKLGVDKTGTAGDIFITDGSFYLGYPSSSLTLDGNLDEAVVFDRVLTENEIDQIFAGNYGAAPPAKRGRIIMVEEF